MARSVRYIIPKVENMDTRELLENHLRDIFARVVYTHKTHEKCADILLGSLRHVNFWQIFLSSITTVGFLTVIFHEGKFVTVTGVLVSGALLFLSTYTLSFKLAERAQKHRRTGIQLWLIREKYLSLINDLRMEQGTVESIIERRDELLVELHKIYVEAPSTNRRAYRKAQKALQKNEELTFSDREIDHLLPNCLRKDADANDNKNDTTS